MSSPLHHTSSYVNTRASHDCQTKTTLQDNPLCDGIGRVDVVRISGSDLDVVNAARVSFGKVKTSISERDIKLIRFLVNHDHTSPLEHTQLSFRIKTPLFVARQWMRHRMASYNEISYRYVKAPLEFYTPHAWRHQATTNRQSSYGELNNSDVDATYAQALHYAYQAYETLLEAGVCREQARGILPNCTYTQFIYTCNLHAFLHFIRLRIQSDAQWEIQQYARAMLSAAYPYFQHTIEAFIHKHAFEEMCRDILLYHNNPESNVDNTTSR